MNTFRPMFAISVLALLAGPVPLHAQAQAQTQPQPQAQAQAQAQTPAQEATSPAQAKPSRAKAAPTEVGEGRRADASTAAVNRPSPPALHLGSFASLRAARFGADGVLDTGAAAIQLIDSATGAPLVPGRMNYMSGPDLSTEWTHAFGDVTMTARMLATGGMRNGDERTKAAIHLTFANRTDAAHTVNFGLRVMPGGGDPELRPLPSLPFKPGIVFARSGNLLTRDGALLLSWVGQDPADVNILPPPDAADAPGALLSWSVELEPQTARYLDIVVVGPHASEKVDESAWREAIGRYSFMQLEEQLIWQSRFRGFFANMELGDKHLRTVLIGSVHLLRLFGDADRVYRRFSDRPYGHPATDVAVEAEVLGIMCEWGFGENCVERLQELVEQAVALGEGLSPDRKLALVHGLCRAVRVGGSQELVAPLAAAIRTLVTEPAAVEPWLDPADVARDLSGILEWAGPAPDGSGAEDKLPEFTWAAEPAGPVEPTMLAMRRAVAARDGAAAWSALQTLLARTNDNGLGSTRADGELDGRFSMGLLTLVRALVIDDHGNDLHLLPLIPSALIAFPGELDLTSLPTRFGPVLLKAHFIGRDHHGLGAQIRLQATRVADHLILHVPFDCKASEILLTSGGSVDIQPDGTLDCFQDSIMAKGLRVDIGLATE